MQDLHNCCASLAGLVLSFIASFIVCFILLVIAPLLTVAPACLRHCVVYGIQVPTSNCCDRVIEEYKFCELLLKMLYNIISCNCCS